MRIWDALEAFRFCRLTFGSSFGKMVGGPTSNTRGGTIMRTKPYEERWVWDRSVSFSHCGNCIANCNYRLYIGGGKVRYEEQVGNLPRIQGVPDMNPLGCQKGAAWDVAITNEQRLLYPMRRVGKRGSGSFERISWDEALDSVADAIIDAIEEQGPDAVVVDEGGQGGTLMSMAKARLVGALGAVNLDGNAAVSDIHHGHWMTFGNLLGGSSADDTFRSEVILVWNANPGFTRIPYYHYLTEARYHGAMVAVIGPDFSPAASHADMFISIEPGTDAAFALSMCKVAIDEGLISEGFVRSQTDLVLLVKKSDKRYLRESDMVVGGRSDRFYTWLDGGLAPVNAALLDDPDSPSHHQLDGEYEVILSNGKSETVTPVFSLLCKRLESFSPEKASKICHVDPDTIRSLARMIARKRTKLYNGLGSCKHYHGDLAERSMDLLLALTGNWGKPGCGFDTYIIALLEGEILQAVKDTIGIEAGERAIETMNALVDGLRSGDPAMSEGKAVLELMKLASNGNVTAPPVFFLYHHGGFRDIWNDPRNGSSPRPFSDYMEEAKRSGWWDGLERPMRSVVPKVFIEASTNTLRRTRGGQRELLRNFWNDLDMVVFIDWRMNSAGLHSDIVLPSAVEPERIELHGVNSHSWERMISDKAFEPAGESRSDWQIFQSIARAVSKRAKERGLENYPKGKGAPRRYCDVEDSFTMQGTICDDEAALEEVLRDSALSGNLPEGTSLASLRKDGWVRPIKLPRALKAIHGTEIEAGKPFVSYRNHVEDRVPFETLTSRAQFYIDHPWFIEAGEELPCHKDPPKMGGNYPLRVTGGHPRWSIHATNTTNPMILETTRGRPVLHMNTVDAQKRGIVDGANVKVFNDFGDLSVTVKVTGAVRPGQVILYASWEPYLFKEWKDATMVEPGAVKWLHLAGGYGHLKYTTQQWQPTQSDRLFSVEVAAMETDSRNDQI